MSQPIALPTLGEIYRGAVRSARLAVTGTGGPVADTAYQARPIDWAVDVLGIPRETIAWWRFPEYGAHRWDGTKNPLVIVANALAAGRDVGVESGTGTGKTHFGGWIVLWFLACFEGAIVVTTAPKEDQLTLHLWKEIGRHFPRFRARYPTAELSHLRLRMKPGTDEQETWAVVGYSCGVDAATSAMGGMGAASRAKGFHAAHMLIVTEETQGIHPAVMTALENTCTGDHNLRLAFGNPEHQLDQLHVFCTSPSVVHVRMSALDHPNVVVGREVIAGAVGRKSIASRAAKYGGDSPLYDAQVRGVSPSEATDALIKLEWCEAAAARYDEPAFRTGVRAKGVDVANSMTGDKAAIADFDGACLLKVRTFRCPNATQLGRDVHHEMQRDHVAPAHVGVDPIGVGAATVNILDEQTGHAIQKLNGGSAPQTAIARAPDGSAADWMVDANLFANSRSQMHWQLREDLRTSQLALPNDPALFRQLTAVRFRTQNGKTVVESKEDLKKRLGGHSPDAMDAVVYGNWVRPRHLVVTRAKTVADPDRETFSARREEERRAREAPPRYSQQRPPHTIRQGWTGRPRRVEVT